MLIFKLIPKLYTSKNFNWIKDLDDVPHPLIVLKWLSMNQTIQKHVSFLNKYAFVLSPKRFLLLVMAVIPRHPKAPFCKYIKKGDTVIEYKEIFDKIQKVGNYSDNDMVTIWKYLGVEKDLVGWCQRLGFEQKMWKKYGLDYNANKGAVVKGKMGLDMFI